MAGGVNISADELQVEKQALLQFRALIDANPDEQAQLLSDACKPLTAVGARVAFMWARHLNAGPADSSTLPAHLLFAPPSMLGPFRITGLLGEGGMARVVQGERELDRMKQRVAIKFVYAPATLATVRERFLRERELLARLKHQAIAPLIDFGETDTQLLWYAMALIEGKAITQHVRDTNAAPAACIALILELCNVVHYAHSLGVIHRDIKPHNVLIGSGDRLHLIDFGIAKELDRETDFQTVGQSPMTPHYASPEQRAGGQISTSSDQWQIAALCCTLLTHDAFPLVQSKQTDLVSAINTPSLDLQAVLRKALREDPTDRYASVAQFALDLVAYQQLRPVEARADQRWYLLRTFFVRHRLSIASAALALLGLIFAAAFSYRAAEQAKEQARVAERTNELMSDIFLGKMQGQNIMEMTLGGFIASGVDQVVRDTQLPKMQRLKLLLELSQRASEAGEHAASERGSREALRLAQNAVAEVGRKHIDQLPGYALGARAQLALVLLNSPTRAQHAAEIDALIQDTLDDGPPKTAVQATTQIVAVRAQAFRAAYRQDFDGALTFAQRSLALTQQWFATDPWEMISAYRMLGVVQSAAGRKAESLQTYQTIVQYGLAQMRANPTLSSTLQWDESLVCEQASMSAPALGLKVCAENVRTLEAQHRLGSRIGFGNLGGLGRSLARLDRSEEALVQYLRAESVLIALEGEATLSLDMGSIRRRIGTRLIALGRPQEAVLPLQFALSVVKLKTNPNAPEQAEVRAELAQALALSGQIQPASGLINEIKNPAAMAKIAYERYLAVQAMITKSTR